MANESFAASYAPPRDVTRSLIAEIAFVALLLVMFVGLSPFAPPVEPASVAASTSSPGDSIRQILFLAIFFSVVATAAMTRGRDALRIVPPALLTMLAWCVLSAFWSAVPDITLRRAALAAIVVISTMLSVDLIGPSRAFFLWRIVLAAVLVINWLSIPLIATAVHLPGDADPGLVGDWRGLYAQKNSAGAVCVMTAILFLFSRNGRNNWIGWLMAAAATGFLIMTRSKTSLVLFPVALAAGGLYRLCWRDALSRAIFLCGALLVLTGAGSGCHPELGGDFAGLERSRGPHRPGGDLAGHSRLHARPSTSGRGFRHHCPYRGAVAAAQLHQRDLGGSDRRQP